MEKSAELLRLVEELGGPLQFDVENEKLILYFSDEEMVKLSYTNGRALCRPEVYLLIGALSDSLHSSLPEHVNTLQLTPEEVDVETVVSRWFDIVTRNVHAINSFTTCQVAPSKRGCEQRS